MEVKELKKELEEEFFLIKKGKLWSFLGGAFSFFVVAGLVSYTATLGALKDTSAQKATKNIILLEENAKKMHEEIKSYLEDIQVGKTVSFRKEGEIDIIFPETGICSGILSITQVGGGNTVVAIGMFAIVYTSYNPNARIAEIKNVGQGDKGAKLFVGIPSWNNNALHIPLGGKLNNNIIEYKNIVNCTDIEFK